MKNTLPPLPMLKGNFFTKSTLEIRQILSRSYTFSSFKWPLFSLISGLLLISFPGFATRYYISVTSGSDANSAAQAQNQVTPWQTVAFAISQAAHDDSLIVLPGTYAETNLTINKRLKLFGNETAGEPGVGVKPVFNGVSGTPNGSIFILTTTDIVIKNFELQVEQLNTIRGIFCNGGGYNRVRIEDNNIYSVNTLTPSVFNSFGIQLGTPSVNANLDSFLIVRNVIRPLTPGSATFGRAIRLVGGFGRIGSADPLDSNVLAGDYGVQAGDIKSTFQLLNNKIYGRSACLELNIPAASRTHTVEGNVLKPLPGVDVLALIELKNNTRANSIIQIRNNRFEGHSIFGLFSTRSRNVFVENNQFIPSDTALNYRHIAVNTKQQTTGNDAVTNSSISITGNNFSSNGSLGGRAIEFQNHHGNTSTVPFTNVVIGGAGALANQFSSNIRHFVSLDSASGNSKRIPLWDQASYPTTNMIPVKVDLDLQSNSFNVGSGLKLPASMSDAELISLENRMIHAIDFDSLGFLTVVPNQAFVTQTSFISPKSTSASVQRALDIAADGWKITLESGAYSGDVNITKTLDFNNEPNRLVQLQNLNLNAAGKTLNLPDSLEITGDFALTSGMVELADNPLMFSNSGNLTGGSETSFIRTTGNGQFIIRNLGASRLFPIGTAASYFPVTLANSGTSDWFGLRVQPDVLANGLTGAPVDSVVAATWVISEGTTGGSNLSVTPRWSGANEKPFFDRSIVFLQGFSGSWSNLNASSVSATGSDPYTATFANITAGFNNTPLRIRRQGEATIPGRLYYVDNVTGDDSRSSNEAKDPNTPWKTITHAVATTIAGDSIQVFAGTYTEFDILVNKSLTILGNVVGVGVGPGAGTGVRPVVNGIGPSPLDSSIFIVRATNVNIRNFNIKVDIDKIKIGINAPQTGFGGLVIEDNLFESTADFQPGGIDVVVLSHAILLGRLIGNNGNGNDSIICRRNIIDREGPGKKWFSRGIRWWGGRGMVGGTNPADGNIVHADFAIQLAGGNTGGRLQTRNNTVFGRAAGIEYNTPPPTFRHTIANNTIRPLDNNGHFALIEIKSNIRTTGPSSPVPPFIDIENNTLEDFYNIGVALTRSRKCNVVNNTFTPRADSTRYTHVWVNSKQRTAGSAASQPPLSLIETLIQGNTFNDNNVFGGYGVAFQNANVHSSGKVFTVNDMGGPGALANTFGANIAKVVYLDTITGPSSDDSFWSNPGVNWLAWPSTPTGPVRDNFDFSENIFNVGSGPKRPSEMTNSELIQLEDRVVHKVDVDTLGFVNMKPNHVFVTLNSFLAPLTTTPRIQRAVNAAGAVDGFTVNIEPGTYNGTTTVSQNMTFDASTTGVVVSSDLGMNGIGKILSLSTAFKVSASLRLDNGLVEINDNDITLESAATVSGGSQSSYISTNGFGYFIQEGLGAAGKKFPVGTGSRYAETQMTNNGTADNIGLRVRNNVLSSGLVGSQVDTVVNFTYNIKEEVPGGSSLSFSPTWEGADERPVFDRNIIFVENHNGTNWVNIGPGTPSVATGSDPYSVTVPINASWNGQPVRVIGRGVAQPVGNLYYVDDATGDDTRTNTEAKNPNTPWKTLTNALARVDNGDSIQVFLAIYNEANLRVLKSVKIFGNVVGIGTGPGAGTGGKPTINGSSLGSDSTIFYVEAPDVQIENFQIEVDQSGIKHGIYGRNGNFNNLRILNNNIFSTANQSIPGLPCVVFNSYGIRMLNGASDSVIIRGNTITPKVIPTNCAFGRGIRGFQGGRFLIGGPAAVDSNTIAALYSIQLGDMNGLPSIIQNNALAANAIELNSPAANSGTHQVINNRLFAGIPQVVLSLLELKNIQNDGTGVNVENNRFTGHSNLGVFSTRSRNVRIANNIFIPADTAKNFRHIHVNTKQQTVAVNQPPVNNEITIVGNDLRGTTTGGGVGIEFANHNDDGGSATAFSNVIIGGTGAEANTFGSGLNTFMRLDPLSGQSASIQLWNALPSTPMAPVADKFDIQNNNFSVSGGLKLPAAMTDAEHYEMENKVIHRIDYDSLGFVTWKPSFAYVTNTSFLTPFTSSPSLQRAVNAAEANDGWQVNIEPVQINESVLVNKSITWNTFPGDSTQLNGIEMNGLGKTLVLQDRFLVANNLTLNNTNGGLIDVGNNDLVALATANVTQGSLNSYVVSNGTGGLIRRGVDDQIKFFPVGTTASYAPVRFQDGNNTGDNFKITVKDANTPADFMPALPAAITTHAKFQWDICEAVPGGSLAEIQFDWVDPSNVNGTGTLDGISRFDGTNWTTVLATIGSGLTARAQGFSDFCSPFAVVSDPNLTTITTQNIIKVQPGVTGRFCVGDSVRIPFTVSGTGILPNNIFNAFLSDATGSFLPSGGQLIGSVISSTAGEIIGVIPASTPAGLNYRVRVVSTLNPVIGIANPDSIKIFELPARPSILGDSTFCLGSPLTIKSTPALNYLWSPGGQTVDSVVVTASGTFTVKVTDQNGCQNTSAPRNVNALAPPVAEPISFTGSLTRCDGDSVVLTANPASFAYQWLNTTPSVTSQTLTVKTSGTWQVIIRNAAGCADTSAPVTTVFNPAPPVPVVQSPNLSVCQPNALEFNAPAGFTYSWSGTGITPTPTSQTVSISTPGSYTVTVTVTNANNCSSTSVPVTGELKRQPVKPSIVAQAGDLSVCERDTIKLQPNPFFANNTYTWQPSAFVGSPLVIFNPGTVSVTLSVDSNGCSNTSVQAVTATINPAPVKPTITVLNGNPTSFCSGDSVTLVSSTGLSYLWTPGGAQTQNIVVKISGSYSVVTLSDSGCASLPSDAVVIDTRPVPVAPIITANKTEFCAGQFATLTVTNPVDGNTYIWSPAGSGITLDAFGPGLHSVRVDSANGCSNFSNIIDLTVNPLPEPIITAENGKLKVCNGDSIRLSSNFTTGNVWSTNATTQSIVIRSGNQNITLTVTDDKGCTNTAGPVETQVFDLPSVNLQFDSALVIRQDMNLVAIPSTQVNHYSWFAGNTFIDSTTVGIFNIKPQITAHYYVVIRDGNGCKATDSVLIRVAQEVYVPNMFSPNGDGRNDRFKVYGFGVKEIEVRVWDRLGNIVFETTNVDEIVETSGTDDSVPGWDGKFKGKEVSEESYIWSVKGKFTTGEDIRVTGGRNSGTVIIMN